MVLAARPGDLQPQHGDGAAPLPQGAPGQPVRPQPGAARRGGAPPRRGGIRGPGRRPASWSASARPPDGVRVTIADIRDAGVEVLTIGQYLQPTSKHLPVDRFVHPDEFAEHKRVRPRARLRPLRVGAARALVLPRPRAGRSARCAPPAELPAPRLEAPRSAARMAGREGKCRSSPHPKSSCVP